MTLPKVVLIGDSIRMGYAPLVIERLAAGAEVFNPTPNGGDSANVLAHLDEWVLQQPPVLVHLNCGLHDLKRDKQTAQYQVPLETYEGNLREIVRRIRAGVPGVALVFATTTPIIDDRHAQRGATFDRFQEDVQRYNAAAVAVMQELGVPLHDLHWVVEQGGPPQLMAKDGTHYTPAGYQRLAEAVADCVTRHLIIARPPRLSTPAGGPEAAAAYQQQEAAHDALVPPAYRDVSAPPFAIPDDAAQWQARRPDVRRTVLDTLGDLPPRPQPQHARIVSRELRRGYTLEKLAIDNGVDGAISALLLVPDGAGAQRPHPAILWLHSSTPDSTQIVTPHTEGGQQSLGEALVQAGYVVLAPDAYWHGDRAGSGPAGSRETRREEQESLFKYHFWLGRTLWGMFVRDDQVALDYLCARPEVDAGRIGATGMSMGSTRAWWLAAVDERVAAAVGVACLTRYQNLIRHGQLRAHGIYYFVNGLLRHFDTEGVLALIAPRPFLALTGDLDAGSPADGIRVLEDHLSRLYAAAGAPDRFRSILYPQVGHTYTPAMRQEMLSWFSRWLHPTS